MRDAAQELLPIAERGPEGIRIRGIVQRAHAHDAGIRHLAVQIIGVSLDAEGEPVIHLNRRAKTKRTGPSLLDICGGHVTLDPGLPRELWSDAAAIQRLFDETAEREANEEIVCAPPFMFTRAHLHRFGAPGEFEAETPIADGGIDREISSAYLLGIPARREVQMWDTDRAGNHRLEHFGYSFGQLEREYRAAPTAFADGAGRIMRLLAADPARRNEFLQLIQKAARAAPGT